MIRVPTHNFPASAAADFLVIPGRGGSGAEHWQSHFERSHANARRVEQQDWNEPDLDVWARRIAASSLAGDRPVLAVAHSFGCLALARAVHVAPRRINEIVLGKRDITADTDLRLARYFGLSEGFFLGLPMDFDLMQRRREIDRDLKAIRPRAA